MLSKNLYALHTSYESLVQSSRFLWILIHKSDLQPCKASTTS